MNLFDKRQVRRSFAQAAAHYDSQAALQRDVALKLIELVPSHTYPLAVDVGCGTGFLTAQLQQRAIAKQLIALDVALPMLNVARAKLASATVDYLCADAERLPFAAHSVDALFSNLALQWCQDLSAVFADFHRVLKADGLLLFSSFAPQTLCELKSAWASVDDYSHVNEFVSAAQTVELLRQAGFQAIELHSELYTLNYSDVLALMRELKGIGAHHVSASRNKAPTSRRQLQQMIAAYPANAAGGITASYEVIWIKARA